MPQKGGFGSRWQGVGYGFRVRSLPGRWINPEKLGGVYLVMPQIIFWCRQSPAPYSFKEGCLRSFRLTGSLIQSQRRHGWALFGDGRLRFPPLFAHGWRMSRRLASSPQIWPTRHPVARCNIRFAAPHAAASVSPPHYTPGCCYAVDWTHQREKRASQHTYC